MATRCDEGKGFFRVYAIGAAWRYRGSCPFRGTPDKAGWEVGPYRGRIGAELAGDWGQSPLPNGCPRVLDEKAYRLNQRFLKADWLRKLPRRAVGAFSAQLLPLAPDEPGESGCEKREEHAPEWDEAVGVVGGVEEGAGIVEEVAGDEAAEDGAGGTTHGVGGAELAEAFAGEDAHEHGEAGHGVGHGHGDDDDDGGGEDPEGDRRGEVDEEEQELDAVGESAAELGKDHEADGVEAIDEGSDGDHEEDAEKGGGAADVPELLEGKAEGEGEEKEEGIDDAGGVVEGVVGEDEAVDAVGEALAEEGFHMEPPAEAGLLARGGRGV